MILEFTIYTPECLEIFDRVGVTTTVNIDTEHIVAYKSGVSGGDMFTIVFLSSGNQFSVTMSEGDFENAINKHSRKIL